MKLPIIIANWKMNKTEKEALEFIKTLSKNLKKQKSSILIAPPTIFLNSIKEICKKNKYNLCSQNIFYKDDGAYTGETSVKMLGKDINFALVGHSERRILFGENNFNVNQKIKALLKNKKNPILCIGENEVEKSKKQTQKVLESQIKEALKNISKKNLGEIIIAYEPIWAISNFRKSKKKFEPDIKELNHSYQIIENYLKKLGNKSPIIIYGGSINIKNSETIFKSTNFKGGIVGHESLDPKHFASICKIISKIKS